jgi:fibrillarin-like rRNA methylase
LHVLTNTINTELLKFSEWFKANKLWINVSKSKYLIFKPRQKRLTEDLSIEVNNHKLAKAKEVLFLGVILDEHLSWKAHISHVANKISKSVTIKYRASFCLFKSSIFRRWQACDLDVRSMYIIIIVSDVNETTTD